MPINSTLAAACSKALGFTVNPNIPTAALNLDFTTGTLDSRVTFTRSTTGSYYNSAGVLSTAAINAPRFDYNPSTLQANGLLIEESRTNLLTYSEQFDNAAWAKTETTVIANATIAPDGTSTADKVIPSTNSSVDHSVNSGSVTVGTTYAVSVYAKSVGYNYLFIRGLGLGGSGGARFNLNTGTVEGVANYSSASIQSVGNGWYRCIAIGTASAVTGVYFNISNTATQLAYSGDGTSGIYLWGAQLEAGSFATSYIPTVASQVTRAADVAVMTGTNFSSWYNQTEGSVYAEYDSAGGVTPCAVSIDDTTSNNRIQVRRGASAISTTGSFRMVVGGVSAIDSTLTTSVQTLFKQAAAIKAGDQASASNGSLFSFTPYVSIPTVTQLNIGNGVSSNPVNGHIKRLTYYNKRLTNQQLQYLTR